MKIFLTLFISTLVMFADSYIFNSTISNSVITDNGSIKKGSGKVVTKVITPKQSFSMVEIDTAADIIITPSNKKTIVIKTDDNLIENVILDVHNNTLFVETKGSIQPTQKVEITIYIDAFKKLKVDGASDVKVRNIQIENFSLDVDGASDIIFNGCTIGRLDIKADGSYDIDLEKNSIDSAYIKAEGSGEIHLSVKNYLDVSLHDTVEVHYAGNPKIKKSVKDVAELSHL